MWDYNYTDELYHHGIKGMKWGVRKDRSSGSVNLQRVKKKTEAAGTVVNESQNIRRNVSKGKVRKAQKQEISNAKAMSDAELRTAVNRLNMEQQYARLTTEQMNIGRTNVDYVLSTVGAAIAVTNSALAIALAIQKLKG